MTTGTKQDDFRAGLSGIRAGLSGIRAGSLLFLILKQIMDRKKPGVDIVKDILEAAIVAYPAPVPGARLPKF